MAEFGSGPALRGGEELRRPIEWVRGGSPPRQRRDPARVAERLRSQLDHVRAQIASLPTSLRGPRAIFRATLYPEYLAASHFPGALLSAARLQSVGSAPVRLGTADVQDEEEIVDAPARALYLAASDRSLLEFDAILQGPEYAGADAWKGVAKIAGLRLDLPDEVLRPAPGAAEDQPLRWEAVLHPQTTRSREEEAGRAGEEAFRRWVALVRTLAGPEAIDPARRHLAEGVCYVAVTLTPAQAREAIRFNGLRVLRPEPPLATRGGIHHAYELFPPERRRHPTRPQSDARVAVFDGGVAPSCPFAEPVTRCRALTPEPEHPTWVSHGTLVTNAVLHGLTPPGMPVRDPAGYVDHYRIVPQPCPPDDPLGDYDMLQALEAIEDTIRTGGYRIANLSFGPPVVVHPGDPPHQWTLRLDQLTLQQGTLFVVAGGNEGQGDPERGSDRICSPGDMANGVTVGSCTRRDEGPVRRAAHSGVGPGRHGGWIRPHGVAPGGDLKGEPFVGIGPGGQYFADEGSSYAAGLVSHGLLGLQGVLGHARARPDTLRAFLTHFSRRPRGSDGPLQVGYGRFPDEIVPLLTCAPNEVTLLYQDTASRGDTFALPLPVPRGLQSEVSVEIRFTLCYTSPVDAADVAGYTQAGFEWRVRPHAYRYNLIDRDTRERLGVVDAWSEADVPESVDGRPVRLARRPRALGLSGQAGTEQRLRTEGKWDTTISKLFRRNAGDLHDPVLELAQLGRERGRLIPKDERPEIAYTLVVTVRTPGSVQLYDAVVAQFGELVPLLTPDLEVG